MKDAQSIQNDLENVKLPAWQLEATLMSIIAVKCAAAVSSWCV